MTVSLLSRENRVAYIKREFTVYNKKVSSRVQCSYHQCFGAELKHFASWSNIWLTTGMILILTRPKIVQFFFFLYLFLKNSVTRFSTPFYYKIQTQAVSRTFFYFRKTWKKNIIIEIKEWKLATSKIACPCLVVPEYANTVLWFPKLTQQAFRFIF